MTFTYWLTFGILLAFGAVGWGLAHYANTHPDRK